MPSKERGGLSKREFAAAQAGKPMPYEKDAGAFSTLTPQAPAPTGMENLGNLKTVLRDALNEAARNRIAKSYEQVAPIAGGVPGSIGSVVSMIKGSVQTPVETIFAEGIQTFRDANEARQVEIDTINKLRLEYGSAIPANVTTMNEAMKYVKPLVDEERRLRLSDLRRSIEDTNDIESGAIQYADQEGKMTGITGTNEYKSKVRIRGQEIMKEREQKNIDSERRINAAQLERANYSDAEFNKIYDVIEENANKGEYNDNPDQYFSDREFYDNLKRQREEEKTKPKLKPSLRLPEGSFPRTSVTKETSPFGLTIRGQ